MEAPFGGDQSGEGQSPERCIETNEIHPVDVPISQWITSSGLVEFLSCIIFEFSLVTGHVKIYTSCDILSRYHELNGMNVVNPMGWDSFGLPAENAALQNDLNPMEWTYSNINSMRHQLESLGLNVEWREATSDPSFFKWTQWLILQLFKNNLLYKSFGVVNWDPVDKTVLADDQVDPDGKSWRSRALVEKRFLKQWFLKTSLFHEDLYKGNGVSKAIDGAHFEQVLQIQRHWLEAPTGYVFYLEMRDGNILPLFTPYPERFLYDDAIIAISNDHWLSSRLLDDSIPIINPVTGKDLWIVIAPDKNDVPSNFKATLLSEQKENEIIREKVLESIDPKIGGHMSSAKYGDWLISRQRYWGTPLPVVECPKCGIQPLNENDLPLQLPPVDDFLKLKNSSSSTDEVRSKLQELAPKEWLTTNCPKCGDDDAVRETDTCDTFVDSSWYYLRYGTEPKSDMPFDGSFVNQNPVSIYLGGPEHITGHLLTSRFIFHFLRKYGYIKSSHSEPYEKLHLQGIVQGRCYKYQGKYITAEEARSLIDEKKVDKKDIHTNWEKMSKSKGNGVNPNELIEEYGTDATRICVLGTGKSHSFRYWRGAKNEFQEITKFMRKMILTLDQFIFMRQLLEEDKKAPIIRRFTARNAKDASLVPSELERLCRNRNLTTRDMIVIMEKTFQLGRANKKLMVLLENLVRNNVNLVKEIGLSHEFQKSLGDLIIMTSPFAPHLSQELWAGFSTSAVREALHGLRYDLDKRVDEQRFPRIDSDFIIPIHIKIDKQISIDIPVDRQVINRADEREVRGIVMNEFAEKRPEMGIVESDIKKLVLFPGLQAALTIETPDERFAQKKKKKKSDEGNEDDEDVGQIEIFKS